MAYPCQQIGHKVRFRSRAGMALLGGAGDGASIGQLFTVIELGANWFYAGFAGNVIGLDVCVSAGSSEIIWQAGFDAGQCVLRDVYWRAVVAGCICWCVNGISGL